MTSDKIIRIGGGSAFFIDSALAVPQLLEAGVDYIILDYLAEGAMGLMGRLRMADAGSGFPADFMDVHIGPHLARIAETRTKIVANAGAVNPAGLASLLRARIAELGIGLNVSCIAGDDLIGRNFPDLPAGLTSVNAYLGAFPIAAALGHGAEIVITGRVVDSALTLGPFWALAVSRASFGSMPSVTSSPASRAFSRALANPTLLRGPSPSSRRLPVVGLV